MTKDGSKEVWVGQAVSVWAFGHICGNRSAPIKPLLMYAGGTLQTASFCPLVLLE